MESLIEQQRQMHEEIERFELVIVNEYKNNPKKSKRAGCTRACGK